jgi:hypothetical protein
VTTPEKADEMESRPEDRADGRAIAAEGPALRLDRAFRIGPLLVTLLAIAAGLVVAGIVANLAYQVSPNGLGAKILGRFLLDEEGTIPAFYSAVLLALCAVAITSRGLAAGVTRAYRARWLALAALFALMSLDEIIHVHEAMDGILQDLLRDPTLHRIWVVPALGLAAVTAFIWLPLLRAQPPRLRLAWVLAGLLYVGGAVGVELLSPPYEPPATAPLSYVLFVGVEEGMEMAGATVFAIALLSSFADRGGRVRVTLGEPVR